MLTHRDQILDQFSRKAEMFASAPALADEASLGFLLRASAATQQDTVLDVACGAGVLVCAFAQKVKSATGIDLVPEMTERACSLAAEKKLSNVHWHVGDVLALPFREASFSLVTSRYALHHIEDPPKLLQEMKRVCTRSGRILIADMVTSEDPLKAAALNRMEKLRDPSHVRSMSATELLQLFGDSGLMPGEPSFYRVELDLESLLKGSHPLPGDEIRVRELFEQSLYRDGMELNVRRERDGLFFSYNIAVLVAQKN